MPRQASLTTRSLPPRRRAPHTLEAVDASIDVERLEAFRAVNAMRIISEERESLSIIMRQCFCRVIPVQIVPLLRYN